MTTRFAILSTGRSGTNYFLSRLEPSPGLLLAWEPFNRLSPTGVQPSELLSRQPEGRRLAEPASSGDTAIDVYDAVFGPKSTLRLEAVEALGFKLFPEHDRELFWRLTSEPAIRVILLERRDRLASYSSRVIADKSGAWTGDEQAAPIAFNALEFEEWCQYQNAVFGRAARNLRSAGVEHLHLFYEEFIQSDAPFEEACALLGLTFTGAPIRVHRQNSADPLDRFSNRSAAARYMVAHRPEFLADPSAPLDSILGAPEAAPDAPAERPGPGTWWYYTVQRRDGGLDQGVYPEDMILLPRRQLSKIDLKGRDALDLCTMEGLIPTLMSKAGAARVVGADMMRPTIFAEPHNGDSDADVLGKAAYVRELHGVDWRHVLVPERASVPDHFRANDLGEFDLVNLSGVLYHVFSPLHWLGAARALVRDGGLMIVSTNVTFDDSDTMRFNVAGALQPNPTTFWYISVGLLDYMLRFFRLLPIDCEHVRNEDGTGYLSVICRATQARLEDPGDTWMRTASYASWDGKWYGGYIPTFDTFRSEIGFKSPRVEERIDLVAACAPEAALPLRGHTRHTAVLRLNDVD